MGQHDHSLDKGQMNTIGVGNFLIFHKLVAFVSPHPSVISKSQHIYKEEKRMDTCNDYNLIIWLRTVKVKGT